MLSRTLVDLTASITEFKKNPMLVMEEAYNSPIAILNRNVTVFYCIPPELYESMIDELNSLREIKKKDSRKN